MSIQFTTFLGTLFTVKTVFDYSKVREPTTTCLSVLLLQQHFVLS